MKSSASGPGVGGRWTSTGAALAMAATVETDPCPRLLVEPLGGNTDGWVVRTRTGQDISGIHQHGKRIPGVTQRLVQLPGCQGVPSRALGARLKGVV